MIKWEILADGAMLCMDQRLAEVRTDGGTARVYSTEDGDACLVLVPDGPADLPVMYGGRFPSYGCALLALSVDVVSSERKNV